MSITLHDLEPGIASAYRDYIDRVVSTGVAGSSEEAAARKLLFARRLTSAWVLLGSILGGGFGASLLLIAHETLWPEATWVLQAAALTWFGCLGGGLWSHFRIQRRLRERPSAEEFAAVARLLSLSAAERAYCLAIGTLLDVAPALGAAAARELLGQLNALLGHSRDLDAHQQHLADPADGRTLADLQGERDRLAARLAATTDPAACQALEQSLQLCEERLRRIEPLAPQLARVEAQREVIFQTLSSAAAALRRLRAEPALEPPPELLEVQESLAEVNAQTRALEDAVEEVLHLGRE